MSNRSFGLSIAAALVGVCVVSAPAHADTILLGSDYLETIAQRLLWGWAI
jgi:hypothetical protein